jgi:hypothetical protein
LTLEERSFRTATRRLIPFLFLIYVVAYLDRVNVSFAQLQLEDDLDFSDTIFGLGAGIFSLGYVLFGRGRHPLGDPRLPGAADGLPERHRRGRGNRADRGGGEPGRLLRARRSPGVMEDSTVVSRCR